MSRRSARVLRGSSFAVIATVLAAAAHTLGGGGAPSVLFCLTIAVLATPIATALAGARMSAGRTAAAVGASQLLFHGAFAVTGDIGVWHPASGHLHAPTAFLAMPDSAAGSDLTMLAAHAAAAAVTALLVVRGEQAVRALLARLPRLRPLPAAVVVGIPLPRCVTAAERRLPVAHVAALTVTVTRRGPPLLSV